MITMPLLKLSNPKADSPENLLARFASFFLFCLFSKKIWHDPLRCGAPNFYFLFWSIFMKIVCGCFFEVFHQTGGGYGQGIVGLTLILRCSTATSSFVNLVLFFFCLERFIWVLHWGLLSNSWWMSNWVLWYELLFVFLFGCKSWLWLGLEWIFLWIFSHLGDDVIVALYVEFWNKWPTCWCGRYRTRRCRVGNWTWNWLPD